MEISTFIYGIKDGKEIKAARIVNAKGAEVTVIAYGGRMVSLKMPDRNGKIDEVILGYDDFNGYAQDTSGQGSLIGRYGNRIAKASFTLNGTAYRLAQNNGRNHLHGGSIGYSARIWDLETVGDHAVRLHLCSPAGEENYPGTLQITVTYTLTEDCELSLHYEAVTDADTVINLTNHSYFNLNSCDCGDVLSHILQLESDYTTEADEELIPTGRLLPVAGGPFDFTAPKAVGQDIDADDAQIRIGKGYDHNFVLRGTGMRRIATLVAEETGRAMDVITDQCGVQVYTANMLCKEYPMRGGRPQTPRSAICLETQHYPDSPNQPTFPSTVLKAGEKYDTTTIFRFYTK